MDSDAVRALVFRYFNSWQEPADWEAFRGTLADDVVFDPGGGNSMQGADTLVRALAATESPWKDVMLLASMFMDDEAALFYEGTEKSSGIKTRVAEHLTISGGKISKVVAAIAPAAPIFEE